MYSLATVPDNICVALFRLQEYFSAIFESGNMAWNSFLTWSAIAIGTLCSQINPENSNLAYATFLLITKRFQKKKKLVIFWDFSTVLNTEVGVT